MRATNPNGLNAAAPLGPCSQARKAGPCGLAVMAAVLALAAIFLLYRRNG